MKNDLPLSPADVTAIRDAALLLELDHLDIAHQLMLIAQRYRPNGQVIKSKIQQYCVRGEEGLGKIRKMVDVGDLAIIPAGFRCHTKQKIAKHLGLKQASLPFDNGFFPPTSVARILKNRQVALKFPDPDNATHQVCTKHMNTSRGKVTGINFRTSSYEEINSLAKDRNQSDINTLLDVTFGYYTLDKVNGFVLAHYNWHRFASSEKSKDIVQPEVNITKINQTFNSRIQRMFDMCDSAQKILFVVERNKSCEFMAIDDEVFNLTDIDPIKDAVFQAFGERAIVVDFGEINTANKLLSCLNKSESFSKN